MTQFNIGDKVIDLNVAEYAKIVGYNRVGNKYDIVYDNGGTASWIDPDDLVKVTPLVQFTLNVKPEHYMAVEVLIAALKQNGTIQSYTLTNIER